MRIDRPVPGKGELDSDDAPKEKPCQCQSAHWGYVFEGRVGFRTDSGEETFEAGDAYYMPAGHTPVFYAGAKIVEFSPTADLDRVVEVVTRNIAAASED